MTKKRPEKPLKIRIRTASGDEVELEGERKAVEDNIKKLDLKSFLGGPRGKALAAQPSNAVKHPTGEDGGIKSLPEFYTAKSPHTHFEKVLTIGYYMENYEKKENFSGKDISKGYSMVRERPPRNLSDTFSKAYRRSGYLLPGSKKGLWRLSKKGVDVVENLPAKKVGQTD
jgi:hypothetical protein